MKQDSADWIENVRMLTESVGAVVPADGSLARVRNTRFVAPGFCRDVWGTVIDMGWLALRVREEAGGLGLGLREATALTRLLGRGLVPEPISQAAFALRLLEQAGCTEVLGAVCDGSMIACVGWQSAPLSLDPNGGVTLDAGRLTGRKIAVCAGADLFVVTLPGGIALVPRDAEGLTVTVTQMHDGSYLAELSFEKVACFVYPCATITDDLFDAMLQQASFLLGVADRAFEITLDYLRTRRQFDVMIGSFQALQHRATEMRVQQALAEASIGAAAAQRDKGNDARAAILRARSRAVGFARLVAREAVQMHGAIGYTDEADIGLFVRKIMVEAGQFAPEFRLREHFIALWNADPECAA